MFTEVGINIGYLFLLVLLDVICIIEKTSRGHLKWNFLFLNILLQGPWALVGKGLFQKGHIC